MEIPSLEEWKGLSEEEKSKISSRWDAYTEGVGALTTEILNSFKEQYSSLPGLYVDGFGNKHGSLVIVVKCKSNFDRAQLPSWFQGICVSILPWYS